MNDSFEPLEHGYYCMPLKCIRRSKKTNFTECNQIAIICFWNLMLKEMMRVILVALKMFITGRNENIFYSESQVKRKLFSKLKTPCFTVCLSKILRNRNIS